MAAAPKPKSKQYIVRRAVGNSYYGSSAYIKVSQPEAGETIYHGDFVKRKFEQDNGPMGTTFTDVYEPVDPKKVTSEVYDGGDEVETF